MMAICDGKMACACRGEIGVAVARNEAGITEIASTLVVERNVMWPSDVQGHHGKRWLHEDE